jgi:type I restriction enzyme, S subunit
MFESIVGEKECMNLTWPEVRLGEVLMERREKPSPDDLSTGRIRIIAKIGFDTGRIDYRSGGETKTGMILIRPGDLVVSGINAAKGAIALFDEKEAEPIAATIHYGSYEVRQERASRDFIWLLLRSEIFRYILEEHLPGGIKTELKAKRLLKIPIPLPPLSEQRRIVAKIDALAAQIEEARELRQKAEDITATFVFSSCEAFLTESEKSYPTEQLNRLVHEGRGISYGVVQSGQDVEGGVPTLRAGNVHWFSCRTNDVKRVAPEIERPFQRTRLQGDELLLRIRGGVGAVAICPRQLIGGNVSREIAVIPLTQRVNPQFAMYLLAAPTNQKRMAGHVKGTSYVGINLSDVRTLRIPLPPLSEQRRIVAYLDGLQAQVDALKALQAETAAELDALLPSILDKAFKGEL